MKLSYHFEVNEVDTVKELVGRKLVSERQFVVHRQRKNVDGALPDIDDDVLWMAHMMCLLTTQQRSGPDSPINVLLDMQPFPLSLTECRKFDYVQNRVFEILSDASGIRRTNNIAKAVEENLAQLKQGEWGNLRHWRDLLLAQRHLSPDLSHRNLEEEASSYMEQFKQFGPKQARNFWQSLGLTRYVFVLDSRILRWLRSELDFENGILTSQGLSDSTYYRFISDMLLQLCNHAEVLPCMLDAAIFDSFDEDTEWSTDTIW